MWFKRIATCTPVDNNVQCCTKGSVSSSIIII